MGTSKVQMVVVDSDGRLLSSANSHVSGDYADVAELRRNVLLQQPVRLVEPFGDYVPCSLDSGDPVHVVAALFSVRPGRSRLLEAPQEVWDWWDDQTARFGEIRDGEDV